MPGFDLLSVSQAGKRLGVSSQTIRAWANAGKLDVQRTMGGHRRIRLAKETTEVKPATASAPKLLLDHAISAGQ